MKMKKRLKDNIATITLIVIVIWCTIHMSNKLNNINYLLWLQNTLPAKIDSVEWRLDNISSKLNNIKKGL